MRLALLEATPADAPDIGEVHALAWRETYQGLLPTALVERHTVKTRAAVWNRRLPGAAMSGLHVVLAKSGERVVGFGSGGPQRSGDLLAKDYDAEIEAVYVRADAQGVGVGRSLMQWLAGRLIADGFHGVSLWVLDNNMRARRFYEALGGQVVGEREEARPEARLREVAYGWSTIRALT